MKKLWKTRTDITIVASFRNCVSSSLVWCSREVVWFRAHVAMQHVRYLSSENSPSQPSSDCWHLADEDLTRVSAFIPSSDFGTKFNFTQRLSIGKLWMLWKMQPSWLSRHISEIGLTCVTIASLKNLSNIPLKMIESETLHLVNPLYIINSIFALRPLSDRVRAENTNVFLSTAKYFRHSHLISSRDEWGGRTTTVKATQMILHWIMRKGHKKTEGTDWKSTELTTSDVRVICLKADNLNKQI